MTSYQYTSPRTGATYSGFGVSSKRARDGQLRRPFTYAEAQDLLAHARNGTRTLRYNTILHHVAYGYNYNLDDRLHADAPAVRLHHTDVVTYHPNGDVTLSSGGWRTLTTSDRLRTYAPYGRVGSERGEWFWYPANGGKRSVLFDGMRISPAGDVINWTNFPYARARQDIEELRQAARAERARKRAAREAR